MGLIKFKQIKPLPFEFRPRYWDPVKEKREERLKELKAMQEDTVEAMKSRISRRLKGGYNEYYHDKRKVIKKQNLMLLAALISVLIISYIFLLKYVPIIENWINSSWRK